MEDFKKFNLMKEEPSTASGGTEQDAAHSFEKIPWGKQEDIDALNAELTRLRSELKQKDEKIVRLLDQIEYQNKIAKEDHDKIKKLEFQISNCDSEFNLPNAAVFNLQQIALADDDMVKVPGAAEQYRFIARHILELFQKAKLRQSKEPGYSGLH